MIHIIYKTTHPNGKYYIGRHSTNNIRDGYKGSGKWVRSIKDKYLLETEILRVCSNESELLIAEQNFIKEHLGCYNNMNFNNSSCGFGSGEFNPAKADKERKRRREFNPARRDDVRAKLSSNNASRRIDVKQKRSVQLKSQWLDSDYRDKHSGGDHHMHRPELREWFKHNNPMFDDKTKQLVSQNLKQAFVEGRSNMAQIVKCEYCGKEVNQPNYHRWHGPKCKHLN